MHIMHAFGLFKSNPKFGLGRNAHVNLAAKFINKPAATLIVGITHENSWLHNLTNHEGID